MTRTTLNAIASVAVVVAFAAFCLYMVFFFDYEVPAPQKYSAKVKLFR